MSAADLSAPLNPAVPPVPESALPVRLPRLVGSLAGAVALFDACFWQVRGMGLSLAVFFAGLTGIILANRENRRGRRTIRVLLLLMAGAVVAAVIETGAPNLLALLVLVVAIAGETFFREVDSPWGRWLSQGIALLRAPGRVFWLGGRLLGASFGNGPGWMVSFLGGALMVGVTAFLVLIFGWLLASGNAVFGSWTSSFFTWIWNELAKWLDPSRIFLWLLAAVAVLPLLRPVPVSAWWWRWTQQLPRLPELVPGRFAAGGSALILAALNVLFLAANAADALFLWTGRTLPGGVTYSQYVHHGVNSLIATVLLSAFLLTAIFQQAPGVAQRRGLKALALGWIAQNFFLVLSVVLRLKLYIEAYDMSVPRLGVIIFLVLVAAGYALLTIKIVWDKSLSWLVGGGVLAIFATFYITQFLNLAGWTANYNVAQWQKNPGRELDTCYLEQLGPAAWPAIYRSGSNDTWKEAFLTEDGTPRAVLDPAHWREFSLRAWLNRWAFQDEPKQ